ncbi:MAG: alpha/beta hydrolase [Gemmatimonadales bacterium]
MADLGFIHRFRPGSRPGATPLLLLHGTGGNEDDLISLGESLAPGVPLVSPRGKVLENGMPRFFRRLAEGVFDLDDLRFRAAELAGFVAAAQEAYDLGDTAPMAVGFSNGANIAAALLLLSPGSLSGAVLLRPMVPLIPEPLPRLDGIPVLIAAGRQDPIVPPDHPRALADLLGSAGAEVTLHGSNAGHGLTREDLEVAERWMQSLNAHR